MIFLEEAVSSNEFMGMLITALAVLVGLAGAIIAPMLKLNKTLTKLNDHMDDLQKQLEEQQKKQIAVEKELSDHQDYLLLDKKRLDNHEARLHSIDEQPGYIDTSSRDGR